MLQNLRNIQSLELSSVHLTSGVLCKNLVCWREWLGLRLSNPAVLLVIAFCLPWTINHQSNTQQNFILYFMNKTFLMREKLSILSNDFSQTTVVWKSVQTVKQAGHKLVIAGHQLHSSSHIIKLCDWTKHPRDAFQPVTAIKWSEDKHRHKNQGIQM